ncbi:MAG: glycine cleavage system protein GcvH [Phycisphaera sp.]|nr:glycine cleavage system protein GcvH [Phycisphaera sp.]
MPSPNDRRYLESHEWHKLESDGSTVTIGVSQFAVDELTDVTYVDITKTAGPIKAGETFGEVESVKATSELYVGVDGEVVKVNQEAIDNPAMLNEDPFGNAWLIQVKASDPAQLEKLLSAADYDKQHGA